MSDDFSPGGWDLDKTLVFADQFRQFLNYVSVNSKELGEIVLGNQVYRAQERFLDGVFDALANDIHDIKVLKSRQLGISTVSRALTLFWIGIHKGLKGYMVFDTDGHKEEARLELITMIESLPASVKFPRIKRQNRYLLVLDNNSMMNFASAGVRSNRGSGTLGRSSGINFVHASEMCSWDNIEGLESFKSALAEDFPDRLFIWESTARGFNQWFDMWEEAKADSVHQKTFFIGWWAKDNQQIAKSHPDFERYGLDPPTEKEMKRIVAVKKQYNWTITPEQLAWIRRKMDPVAQAEGDAPAEHEGSALQVQENPWTEEEAFQQTGATFFQPEDLTEVMNNTVSKKFSTYGFIAGLDFKDCRVVKAHNARSVELKVWEEPVSDGVYVISADVAFGHDEKNDRSAIQVLRCYADGLDQVAEYAWPLISSRQFAWMIATLLGWYGSGEAAECYLIVEINGPGEATWNELQSLKRELQAPYQPSDIKDNGIYQIFKNVRNYIYTRSDSMSVGHNYQFKTSGQLKVAIMERLRDFVGNRMLTLRSADTVHEMNTVRRDGDSIAAERPNKDDRVMALAMAVRCWEERVRRTLMGQKRTRANEEAKTRLTIRDQIGIFNENMLTGFFAKKIAARRRVESMARRSKWRGH